MSVSVKLLVLVIIVFKLHPSTLLLHYNAVDGVHWQSRPLSQVFTYVNKCPTHRHLVWDIRQCI